MNQLDKLKMAVAIGIRSSDDIDPRRLYPDGREQRALASIYLEQLEDKALDAGAAHHEMVSMLDKVMAVK